MGTPRTPTILTSPQDAAIAFYRAFEAKDVDAMMLTWAEDEDIVCIHPGGTRLVGYDAVRAGWEQLFAGNTKLSFRLDEIVAIETVGLALQSAVEHVTVGDDPKPRGAAIATNVFMRTPSGWRIKFTECVKERVKLDGKPVKPTPALAAPPAPEK